MLLFFSDKHSSHFLRIQRILYPSFTLPLLSGKGGWFVPVLTKFFMFPIGLLSVSKENWVLYFDCFPLSWIGPLMSAISLWKSCCSIWIRTLLPSLVPGISQVSRTSAVSTIWREYELHKLLLKNPWFKSYFFFILFFLVVHRRFRRKLCEINQKCLLD